jgi:hypothetical protein
MPSMTEGVTLRERDELTSAAIRKKAGLSFTFKVP